jgi:hypothetical protein
VPLLALGAEVECGESECGFGSGRTADEAMLAERSWALRACQIGVAWVHIYPVQAEKKMNNCNFPLSKQSGIVIRFPKDGMIQQQS